MYHYDCNYTLPPTLRPVAKYAKTVDSALPTVISTISPFITVVSDKHDFYTTIAGDYIVLIYEHDNFRIAIFRLKQEATTRICIKSVKLQQPKYGNFVQRSIKPTPLILLPEFNAFEYLDQSDATFCKFDNKRFVPVIVRDNIAYFNDACYETKQADNETLYDFQQNQYKPLSDLTFVNANDLKIDNDETVIVRQKSYSLAYSLVRVLVCKGNYSIRAGKHLVFFANAKDHDFANEIVALGNVPITMPSSQPTDQKFANMIKHNNAVYTLDYFQGRAFRVVTDVHRNHMRHLYKKYAKINLLDVGIGRGHDIRYYSAFVKDIYGIEPNEEYLHSARIPQNNKKVGTINDIVAFSKQLNKKFHTIVFNSSFNFIEDLQQTLADCASVMEKPAYLIAMYLNNEKLTADIDNAYYTIKQGKTNYIELKKAHTHVTGQYEYCINESDLLKVAGRHFEIVEHGHIKPNVSLIPELKQFNALYYYIVLKLKE